MISNKLVFIALVMLTVIFVKNMYSYNPVRPLNTRTVKWRPAEGLDSYTQIITSHLKSHQTLAEN
jgi:hypothetical protein